MPDEVKEEVVVEEPREEKKGVFGKDTITLMGSCTFMIILGSKFTHVSI